MGRSKNYPHLGPVRPRFTFSELEERFVADNSRSLGIVEITDLMNRSFAVTNSNGVVLNERAFRRMAYGVYARSNPIFLGNKSDAYDKHLAEATERALSDFPDDNVRYLSGFIDERLHLSRDPLGFLTISIPWRPGIYKPGLYDAVQNMNGDMGDALRQMRLVFHVGGAMLDEDTRDIDGICADYFVTGDALETIKAPHYLREGKFTPSEAAKKFGMVHNESLDVPERYERLHAQSERRGMLKSMAYFVSTIDSIESFMHMTADHHMQEWLRTNELM